MINKKHWQLKVLFQKKLIKLFGIVVFYFKFRILFILFLQYDFKNLENFPRPTIKNVNETNWQSAALISRPCSQTFQLTSGSSCRCLCLRYSQAPLLSGSGCQGTVGCGGESPTWRTAACSTAGSASRILPANGPTQSMHIEKLFQDKRERFHISFKRERLFHNIYKQVVLHFLM